MVDALSQIKSYCLLPERIVPCILLDHGGSERPLIMDLWGLRVQLNILEMPSQIFGQI